MNQEQKDRFAGALGISPETQETLDTGGSHDYLCTCDTCRKWWQEMGPDPDGCKYGAFSPEDIEDDSPAGKQCAAIRNDMMEHPENY